MKSSKKPSSTNRDLLTRGVVKVYPSKEAFEKVLRSGKKISIYIGADPTAPQLHLGHLTNFLILRKLQDLGHKIIILIGDFTGTIGDPTDKSATRRQLTRSEVVKNAKTYKDQISKVLRFKGDNPAEIKFNSQWLSKLTPAEFIRLMAMFTTQQMLERDMFQARLKQNKPIYLHEFVYPILQGYDSVAMSVDAEMGGTDQTFNMLVGRELMRELKRREKFVITTELLVNPKTGHKLMSKSEGGYVALSDTPKEMFGKIMALPDEVIEPMFRLCTTIDLSRVNFSDRPMDLKKKLAFEIVKELNSEKEALGAQEEFEKVFSKKEMPSKLRNVKLSKRSMALVDILVAAKLSSSKSQAFRLITQGGVEIDGLKVTNPKEVISVSKAGRVIKAGKKNFVKII